MPSLQLSVKFLCLIDSQELKAQWEGTRKINLIYWESDIESNIVFIWLTNIYEPILLKTQTVVQNAYNNLLFTDEEFELGTEQLEKLFEALGTRKE